MDRKTLLLILLFSNWTFVKVGGFFFRTCVLHSLNNMRTSHSTSSAWPHSYAVCVCSGFAAGLQLSLCSTAWALWIKHAWLHSHIPALSWLCSSGPPGPWSSAGVNLCLWEPRTAQALCADENEGKHTNSIRAGCWLRRVNSLLH